MKTPTVPHDPIHRGEILPTSPAFRCPNTNSFPADSSLLEARFNLRRTLDLTLFNPCKPFISRLCTVFHVNKNIFPKPRLSRLAAEDAKLKIRAESTFPQAEPRHLHWTILHPAICTLHSRNPHGTALFCSVPRNENFLSSLHSRHFVTPKFHSLPITHHPCAKRTSSYPYWRALVPNATCFASPSPLSLSAVL